MTYSSLIRRWASVLSLSAMLLCHCTQAYDMSIMVSYPLTGSVAVNGQQSLDAARLFESMFNSASYEPSNDQLERLNLVFEPDATNVSAICAAKEAGIDVFVGSYAASLTEQYYASISACYPDQSEAIMVAPLAGSPSLFGLGNRTNAIGVITRPTARLEQILLTLSSLGAKTLFVLKSTTIAEDSCSPDVHNLYTAVAPMVTIADNRTNLFSTLNVIAVYKPDVVLLCGNAKFASDTLAAARSLNLNAKAWVGLNAFLSAGQEDDTALLAASTIESANWFPVNFSIVDAARDMSCQLFSRLGCISPYQLNQIFLEELDHEGTIEMATSFCAFELITQALGMFTGRPTAAELNRALRSMSFTTACGRITLGWVSGQNIGYSYIRQAQFGSVRMVAPLEHADASLIYPAPTWGEYACLMEGACSGHGTCMPDGSCDCQGGYAGRHCERYWLVPVQVTLSILAAVAVVVATFFIYRVRRAKAQLKNKEAEVRIQQVVQSASHRAHIDTLTYALHELGNPACIVLQAAGQLRSEAPHGVAQNAAASPETVADLHGAAIQITRVLEDMSLITADSADTAQMMIAAHDWSVHNQECDVSHVFRDVRHRLRMLYSVSLETVFPQSSTLPAFTCDSFRLMQLLTHLCATVARSADVHELRLSCAAETDSSDTTWMTFRCETAQEQSVAVSPQAAVTTQSSSAVHDPQVTVHTSTSTPSQAGTQQQQHPLYQDVGFRPSLAWIMPVHNCEAVAAKMGGRISVSDRNFVVYLPLQPAAVGVAQHRHSATPPPHLFASSSARSGTTTSMRAASTEEITVIPNPEASLMMTPASSVKTDGSSNSNVLVVLIEDDKVVRKIVERTLQQAGYSCVSYSDGADVDIAELGKQTSIIRCILLDIVMPRSDGVQVCRAMRTAGFRGKIIAMTANALPADWTVFSANGFDALLAKPFTHSALLAMVQQQ